MKIVCVFISKEEPIQTWNDLKGKKEHRNKKPIDLKKNGKRMFGFQLDEIIISGQKLRWQRR